MAARILLGAIAALGAVLIPGQADVLATRPLTWPKPALPATLRAWLAIGDGSRGDARSVRPA